MSKSKQKEETAVIFLLTISKELQKKYDGVKTLFPVPVFRFGLLFFSLPDNKDKLKTILLTIMKEKEEDLKDLAKMFTMHNIPLKELLIKLVLHYKDFAGKLQHYYIEVSIEEFLEKLDDICADLILFEKVIKQHNLKFLDIKEALKQYDYAKEFCEVVVNENNS